MIPKTHLNDRTTRSLNYATGLMFRFCAHRVVIHLAQIGDREPIVNNFVTVFPGP